MLPGHLEKITCFFVGIYFINNSRGIIMLMVFDLQGGIFYFWVSFFWLDKAIHFSYMLIGLPIEKHDVLWKLFVEFFSMTKPLTIHLLWSCSESVMCDSFLPFITFSRKHCFDLNGTKKHPMERSKSYRMADKFHGPEEFWRILQWEGWRNLYDAGVYRFSK